MEYKHMYEKCMLCKRACAANRLIGENCYCKSPSQPRVSRAALHMWEEPIISGSCGSGTIFFSGCSLGCIYCQNRAISRGECGVQLSEAELSDVMLALEKDGAHNINLVTPTHYVPSIIEAVSIARDKGLAVPIVYNTGSYDRPQTVKLLEGTVDIYIPDFKYYRDETAQKLSKAGGYVENARAAVAEMVRQQPKPIIENGLMKKGVIVRVLLLPSHIAEAKLTVKYLYSTYGGSIYISLMNQYTPMQGMDRPLNRRVTAAEYYELVNYADKIGVKNAFIQEDGTQSESFIPDFDNTIAGM